MTNRYSGSTRLESTNAGNRARSHPSPRGPYYKNQGDLPELSRPEETIMPKRANCGSCRCPKSRHAMRKGQCRLCICPRYKVSEFWGQGRKFPARTKEPA